MANYREKSQSMAEKTATGKATNALNKTENSSKTQYSQEEAMTPIHIRLGEINLAKQAKKNLAEQKKSLKEYYVAF